MTSEFCRSWPHCENAPAADSPFCSEHAEIMQRVRDQLAQPGLSKQTIKGTSGKAAPIVVKHVAPVTPSSRRVTEHYKEQILAALEDGPLTGRELAKAAGSKSTTRSFQRARLALLQASEIVQGAGGPKRAKTYRLPSAAT